MMEIMIRPYQIEMASFTKRFRKSLGSPLSLSLKLHEDVLSFVSRQLFDRRDAVAKFLQRA